MRRATSCKYMSTTPTASVLENKVGVNIRKHEASADRADRVTASRALCAADCHDNLEHMPTHTASVSACMGFGKPYDHDDDELVFGFDE